MERSCRKVVSSSLVASPSRSPGLVVAIAPTAAAPQAAARREPVERAADEPRRETVSGADSVDDVHGKHFAVEHLVVRQECPAVAAVLHHDGGGTHVQVGVRDLHGSARRISRPCGALGSGHPVGIPAQHHPPAARQPDSRRVRVAVGRRPALPLGAAGLALGQQVASTRGFAGTVLPQMEWLSQQTGEAVLMSVLDGARQLYVHYVAVPQQVGVMGERGRHGPLHCTSMGKVLVAFAPDAQSVRLVDTVELTRLGPNTITDRDRFLTEIASVRSHGSAIADEEHETGIRAIGMPILDIGGWLRAAISVAAPAFRCTADELTEFLPARRSAADKIKILLPSS